MQLSGPASDGPHSTQPNRPIATTPMTSANQNLGSASDALLKITTGMSRPSSWTGREMRREAQRNARKAAKRLSINDRRLQRGGF